MRKGGKYNPMEILHSQLLEVFHEKRATLEARELLILSGKDLNEMIVEAKKRTSLKSASQLIDNDLKKVLIQGERIQRITDLEAENERLRGLVAKCNCLTMDEYENGLEEEDEN